MSNERAPQKKPDETKKARPPTQSLIDEERGDWEGMGQSRHQPEIPPFEPKVGKPTPGSNAVAGAKQK